MVIRNSFVYVLALLFLIQLNAYAYQINTAYKDDFFPVCQRSPGMQELLIQKVSELKGDRNLKCSDIILTDLHPFSDWEFKLSKNKALTELKKGDFQGLSSNSGTLSISSNSNLVKIGDESLWGSKFSTIIINKNNNLKKVGSRLLFGVYFESHELYGFDVHISNNSNLISLGTEVFSDGLLTSPPSSDLVKASTGNYNLVGIGASHFSGLIGATFDPTARAGAQLKPTYKLKSLK